MMRIVCDVCGTAAAAVICCADEAMLCAKCDEEVHAANKLASKHRRLPLHCGAAKFARCDICQEKSAFIFCVEDRALFCQDCDQAIHITATRSANHQRLLATGIRVGFASPSTQNPDTDNHHPEPPNFNSVTQSPKIEKERTALPSAPSPLQTDDFLHLSDYDSYDKEPLAGFEELLWFSDFGAAEVPDMFFLQPSNETLLKSVKASSGMPFIKPRVQVVDDEFLTVPDLG